jgi:hypothetical protein
MSSGVSLRPTIAATIGSVIATVAANPVEVVAPILAAPRLKSIAARRRGALMRGAPSWSRLWVSGRCRRSG